MRCYPVRSEPNHMAAWSALVQRSASANGRERSEFFGKPRSPPEGPVARDEPQQVRIALLNRKLAPVRKQLFRSARGRLSGTWIHTVRSLRQVCNCGPGFIQDSLLTG